MIFSCRKRKQEQVGKHIFRVPKFFFCHSQRLSIAKEFGDKAAERRAYSNLGNALIFLGQFNTATDHYRWEEIIYCYLIVKIGIDLCVSV